MPIAAVAMHEAMVNHTTHGLWRPVVSEIAPKTGIDRITSAETRDFAIANRVLETPRSATIHADRKSVPIFIENIVLEKSYITQLHRSRAGASATVAEAAAAIVTGSVSDVIAGGA